MPVSRKDVHLYQNDLARFYGCLTKVVYFSIIPATKQAYVLSQQRRRDYEPYLCRYCGEIHVGRVQKKEKIDIQSEKIYSWGMLTTIPSSNQYLPLSEPEPAASVPAPTHEEIAQLAYSLWESRERAIAKNQDKIAAVAYQLWQMDHKLYREYDEATSPYLNYTADDYWYEAMGCLGLIGDSETDWMVAQELLTHHHSEDIWAEGF